MNVQIRPLNIEDAYTSVKWRNNPDVWKLTGSRPDREVAIEMELEWIKNVLKRDDQKRYAILADNKYIGNIYLTDIVSGEAELHSFIGETNYWGQGIAAMAIKVLMGQCQLSKIYALIRPDNEASIKMIKKCGFIEVESDQKEFIRVEYVYRKPFVSIHMMTYNHARYVAQAIEGVVMQETNFDYQLVIGDDCSSDETSKICKEYQAKYPEKIKLILREKNIGAYANMVDIFNNCTGKYIAMCEGDDYWIDPMKLQKQIDILEHNPQYTMVVSNRKQLYADGRLVNDDYKKRIFTNKDILYGIIPATQTMVFKNDSTLLEFFNNNKEFFSGDRMIAYHYSLRGDIYSMPDYTAVYRHSGVGVWSGLSSEERGKKYIQSFYDFHKLLNIPNRRIFANGLIEKNLYILYRQKSLNLTSYSKLYKQLRGELSHKELMTGTSLYICRLIYSKLRSELRFKGQ